MKKYLLLVQSKESPGRGVQSSDSPTEIPGASLGGNFYICIYKGLIIICGGGHLPEHAQPEVIHLLFYLFIFFKDIFLESEVYSVDLS